MDVKSRVAWIGPWSPAAVSTVTEWTAHGERTRSVGGVWRSIVGNVIGRCSMCVVAAVAERFLSRSCR